MTLFPCLTAWLSLQVQPDPVFEGDILTLRCWGRRNAALSQVKFYRDGKFLHLSKDNQPLSTGTATVNSSGRYSCTGQVTYMQYVGRQTSRTVMVQVQGESQLGGLGGAGRVLLRDLVLQVSSALGSAPLSGLP